MEIPVKPTDQDERLRVLRRELSLVIGQRTKPTKIPAAQTPRLRRFFESQRVRESRESAVRFENLLNEQIPKPETREDHALLKKARSPEQIKCDINAIPAISAHHQPEVSIDFGDFWFFQLWFAPADRYSGREAPSFVRSRDSISTKTIQNGLCSDTAFPPYNTSPVDEVAVHSDKRDRSVFSTDHSGTRWILSTAMFALLRGDVRFCADPRHGNYDVFLGHPKQPKMSLDDTPISLHIVRKTDHQSKHFKIFENRT